MFSRCQENQPQLRRFGQLDPNHIYTNGLQRKVSHIIYEWEITEGFGRWNVAWTPSGSLIDRLCVLNASFCFTLAKFCALWVCVWVCVRVHMHACGAYVCARCGGRAGVGAWCVVT
jgi:hypothetical protein